MRGAAVAGVVVVGAHLAGFTILMAHDRGTPLAVEVTAPLASPVLALDGKVPPVIADRVTTELVGQPPGLARRTWTVRYRGGYERSVGAVQLVGPFQDPAARACTGRVVVGQRLLDDGKAGAGTVAGEMAKRIDAELQGTGFVGIGDYRRVEAIALRWAQLDAHPEDKALVTAAPHGYVRVEARLKFDRVDVPLVVALVPQPSAAELKFIIHARAELDFGNRFVQWISDKLGGGRFASRLARREIDNALITALAPPPPLELPGEQTLTFLYCDGPPEIVEGVSGALPFAVQIGRVAADPAILPPRRGPAPHIPLAPNAAVAIDLDLDALDALLYELWRTGFLDRRLAEAGLDRRFNDDPTVSEFLSIRISSPRLALPPVLSASPRGLRLSADARIAIADGQRTTVGRVWGGLDFTFAETSVERIAVDLGALELSCERSPTVLVPCYADLVATIRDRGPDFHGELTQIFATLLADIFVDRHLGASGLPAELVIRSASPSVLTNATNGSLHLDLDASIVTTD